MNDASKLVEGLRVLLAEWEAEVARATQTGEARMWAIQRGRDIGRLRSLLTAYGGTK